MSACRKGEYRSVWLLPVLALAAMLPAACDEEGEPTVKKDAPYVATPHDVVDAMLELAQPKAGEVLYDLGCGDGRIVIAAAKKYGVTGVGVDIDPERIEECNENARAGGVTDRVRFVVDDLFKMDFRDADIVTLYLSQGINNRLRPQLLEQLEPGTRVVSHSFNMADWRSDREAAGKAGGGNAYLWIVPSRVAGTHAVTLDGRPATLDLAQRFQEVTGTATIDGKRIEIRDGRLRGRELTFTADGKQHTVTIGGSGDHPGKSATQPAAAASQP